jgi:hypothetical protein
MDRDQIADLPISWVAQGACRHVRDRLMDAAFLRYRHDGDTGGTGIPVKDAQRSRECRGQGCCRELLEVPEHDGPEP